MARLSKVDTLLDLTPEQLMQMSRKDLAKNISILSSAANKRLKRLEASGTYSPSAEWVYRHGGKFSVAGKTKNQLLIEFFRVQEFLESKTSTVRGAKKWKRSVKNAVIEAVQKRYADTTPQGRKAIKSAVEKIFTDKEWETRFWDVYSRLTEEYDVKEKYKEVWDDIANAIISEPNKETDDIYNMLSEPYEILYQQTAPKDTGKELML